MTWERCHGAGWLCEEHGGPIWSGDPCIGPRRSCDAPDCPVSGTLEWDERFAGTKDGHDLSD